MWLLALGLILASAGLHAGWNLIVKREEDKLISGWLTVLTPCLLLSPTLFVVGLPPRAAWPILLASGLVQTGYMLALTRAYRHGDLSVVYPIARGLAPLLVAIGAPPFLGERLSPPAILGIVLVGGGIACLGWSAKDGADGPALGWALATALCIATYSMLDKVGVARSNPLAYIIVLFGWNAATLAPFVLLRPRGAGGMRAVHWGMQVIAGLCSLSAYLLVLVAMRLIQVSYVAALREVSVILAVLLGWRVLREPYGLPRLAASAVVALGLGLLVVAMRG